MNHNINAKHMKTLIIGAGAVGTIVAGMLAQKGFDVHLVCKNKQQAEHINKIGLAFEIKKRTYYQPIKAFDNITPLTNKHYDYIFFTTKAFDMQTPAQQALAKLSENGLMVPFQDGYCEEMLTRIAGSERVVGAIIAWGATYNNDKHLASMSSKGEMIIGKLDGSDDPRLDNLQYMLNQIAPTKVVNNIHEQIYSKLIINSCVTTLGAITGYNVGALITVKKLRNTFLQIINEAILVADILKIEIPDYTDRINYYRLVRGTSIYHRLRKHIHILIFGFKYRKVKSSGLQSLERNEQTEVDYLNGYLVDKANEIGIELPVNSRLVEMVHEIENGKRKIQAQNLDEALFGLK